MSIATADFAGRPVTVMGLGRFGGGLGAVRYLLDRGADVTVSDLRTADELAGPLSELPEDSRLHLHLGGHREADFQHADIVVVNPAVRPGHPLVEVARRCGASITSEIGLFWQHCRGRIAGVTGTNGKSTTTKLLHHLLETDGRPAWLGGNIGTSLLPVVDRIGADDWVVLELSSFQLEALDLLRVSPQVAVVTNFAPNHLDWHGTLAAYRHAKQTILRWQRPEAIAVLNAEGEVGRWETHGRKLIFQGHDPAAGKLVGENPSLHGPHRQENVAAARLAAQSMGVSDAAIEQGLSSFVGLPHRLQCLGTYHSRRWIEDSASTTPESTLAALAGFAEPPVLLVGGADKGVDLSPLADGIAPSAKAAVLMGAVAGPLQQLIQTSLAALPKAGPLRSVTVATSLPEAVAQAITLSQPGDTVLFSPGCASYGWFANYEERGNEFARLIRELA